MREREDEQVRQVLAYYEGQTEDEAAAEDEAAFADPSQVVMVIPRELVPIVRALIAQHDQLFESLKARVAILPLFDLKDQSAFPQPLASRSK
jgi:hypothetical protein